MERINDFKRTVFPQGNPLGRRLAISQKQLDSYFSGLALADISNILTISDPRILNFLVTSLLQQALISRKVTNQAFIVTKRDAYLQEQPALYAYDSKLFRNSNFSRQQNDFVSSFLICYKQNMLVEQPVHEIVDVDSIVPCQWVLKVKESCLLKVYAYIREIFSKLGNNNDKMILDHSAYFSFMQEWLRFYFCANVEANIHYTFQAILILLQNQLLLHYVASLSPQQKLQHMHKLPIRLIEKPKSKEQFTLTENKFGEVGWQSLKITAFQLKFRVEEDDEKYSCFLPGDDSAQYIALEELKDQDQNIMMAFEQMRGIESEYHRLY